jgi:hypothetical protein
MTPETYIVRVYRRSSGQSLQLVGRVETPGGNLCAGFASLPELAAILQSPADHLREPRATGSPEASGATTIRLHRQDL